VKENIDIFESILFVEMKISKLIIHSTDMCQSYGGIKIQCQTPKHNSNQYKAHTLQKRVKSLCRLYMTHIGEEKENTSAT
jgi:hypothetical protein